MLDIAETQNYIQFVDVENYNIYTGEVNKFNTITHKGITYIPLKSKKEEGKDCFWNKETGGILVWFSRKKNWYPEVATPTAWSIDSICKVTIMNEFEYSFDSGNIENVQIDIDAYMRGEVDIEFEPRGEGGRTQNASVFKSGC